MLNAKCRWSQPCKDGKRNVMEAGWALDESPAPAQVNVPHCMEGGWQPHRSW